MFNPSLARDRINYGEVLTPPIGFHLEKAIGTTYSLDLETLTAISISLGLVADTDSELITNPIGMLKALQDVSNKITVFCEAGQIKMPVKTNPLCLMLEKMVVPVKLPFDNEIKRYPAFHPKMWLIEYANLKKEKKYRFVVMSRNMTFDHSWDIACAMDGEVTTDTENSSKTIIGFLSFLNQQLNASLSNYQRQSDDLSYFIKLLKKIKFDIGDDRFETEYSICPLGIGVENYEKPIKDNLFNEEKEFDELVVMSPFLTGSIIKKFNGDSKKNKSKQPRVLITRRSSLPKLLELLQSNVNNFDIYVMKNEIVDGEEAISDENTSFDREYGRQDIHAKIFICRQKEKVDLYLGSMNASYAAINSNVELVLKLQPKNNILNLKNFCDDIMGKDPNKSPFELIRLENVVPLEEDKNSQDIEQIIKKICRYDMSAQVLPNGNTYDVKVTIKIDKKLDGVKIRPISNRVSNLERELSPVIEFKNLDVLDLSEFYAISVTVDDCTLERVIMIPTSGIPQEGREKYIVKDIIKDKKSFIEYVSFVLGDDYVQSFLENKKLSLGASSKQNTIDMMPAIYEKLLKASLLNPEKLNEIQSVMKLVDEESIVSPEFREMYQMFCDTLKIK